MAYSTHAHGEENANTVQNVFEILLKCKKEVRSLIEETSVIKKVSNSIFCFEYAFLRSTKTLLQQMSASLWFI